MQKGYAQALSFERAIRATTLWRVRDLTGTKPLMQSCTSTETTPSFAAANFAAAALPPHVPTDEGSREATANPACAQHEPWLGEESPVPPIDEEYVRNYEAQYGRFGGSTRRSAGRMFLLAAFMFAVGAAVGLAGAWWSGAGKPRHSASFDMQVVPVPLKEVRLPEDRASTVMRGISASELPFDGEPPSDATEPRQRGPASVDASSLPQMPPVSTKDGGPPVAAPRKPSAKTAEKASNRSKAMHVESSDPSRKTGTPSRAARDGEIDRIRRQAAEELKKKTEKQHVVNANDLDHAGARRRNASRSSELSRHIRVRLVRCGRMTNLISREVCKWQLCNGMWGKNGCPSYPPRTPSY